LDSIRTPQTSNRKPQNASPFVILQPKKKNCKRKRDHRLLRNDMRNIRWVIIPPRRTIKKRILKRIKRKSIRRLKVAGQSQVWLDRTVQRREGTVVRIVIVVSLTFHVVVINRIVCTCDFGIGGRGDEAVEGVEREDRGEVDVRRGFVGDRVPDRDGHVECGSAGDGDHGEFEVRDG